VEVKKLFKKNNRIALLSFMMILSIVILGPLFINSVFKHEFIKNDPLYKAASFASNKMDQIIADKRLASYGKGFNYILQPGLYPDDVPEAGFSRHVSIDTTGKLIQGVRCAEIRVTVSYPRMRDVVLTTVVADY
jgi:hypothetical protein